MRRFLIISVTLLLATCAIFARDNVRIGDIRTVALGGNGVTGSSLYNPALLALDSRMAAVSYYNAYQLKELSSYTARLCLPNKLLPVGFTVASFGYDEYRESLFRLSLAKWLHPRWALGIGLQYAMIQSEIFEESPSFLSVDIGASFEASSRVRLAASVVNWPAVRLNDATEQVLPYSIKVGVQWQMLDDLTMLLGYENEPEYPCHFAVGAEYAPYDFFRIRLGLHTHPMVPTGGVGLRWESFSLNISAAYHPELGVSQGIELIYSF